MKIQQMVQTLIFGHKQAGGWEVQMWSPHKAFLFTS